ncbi:RecX family transcriptional regulator [Candidatus Saccharibacteria bacterium]|nr:RecX family transcriptional regulator [Candidatus Saccharibacteria bacterium]
MEIYKLSDDVARDSLRITDIRQAVKNENRVNVFVDGKYSFSLDVSQVVELKLKVGQKISAEDLEEFESVSEFGKLYQRALEWVLTRPRSERETRDYLYKKVYNKKLDKGYINKIIDKLRDKKYLDDEGFAEWYVENRFVKKGISQKRLKMELIKKGVSNEIIEKVLSVRNDEEEILKMIAKKRDKYDDDQLIQYLCRQGFSFELARNLVLTYGKD